MTAPVDLDAIEARAAAATPGPWKHIASERGDRESERTHTVSQIERGGHLAIARVRSWDQQPENATFIASARTDVPAMAREIRELRAEVAALKAGVQQLDANWSKTHRLALETALAKKGDIK